jgi:hypothetical protein
VAEPNVALRVNPGGHLTPAQVVGRDVFIGAMWRALERQSVLLTAERRMGKTSVLNKMLAEPASGRYAIKRSLQGITSPDEFVRHLIADTEARLPGLLRQSVGTRLAKAGVRRIGVSALSVEFDPSSDQSWKDVASETLAVLDRETDVAVVLLWDELPHMVAAIRDNHGPLVARALLDLLRSSRETFTSLRMVFSGSLGIHHVVDELRAHGGMWVPTHDMLALDLPPLLNDDAQYLARELLRNEQLSCDDVDAVAAAVAVAVDGAPYYVHHTVHQLRERQRCGRCGEIDAELVYAIVDETLVDPLDPWQLQHYVDRVETYYGEDSAVVKAALDVVALAEAPPKLETIHEQIGAQLAPPSLDRLRELLVLVCKDHYLSAGPAFAFRLDLVRRAWVRRRSLA